MDFFKLKEHKTNVKIEAIAGFTTFLTMLYIVPVNAMILSGAGMPFDALITATALMTIFATILNGFWSNTPVAMSAGMGLNAYFVIIVTNGTPWQTALGVVFLSGLLFVILSFTKFRIWVLQSISEDLRRAVSAGIGAFIAFIGLKQMGIVVDAPFILVKAGNFKDPNVLIGLFGIVVVLAFSVWKVRGAFILAILLTSVVAWLFNLASFPSFSGIFSMPASISPIAFELDIKGALTLSLLPVIITFLITDLFDSLGTLAGVGFRAGLFKNESKELEKTLEVDALASAIGAVAGISTTTSFIESASGVEEGGRTGLTAIFTGLFFVLTLFMLPLFKAIPANAIYPVLVMVGILMFVELARINFSDLSTSAATFLIVLMMPMTSSITNGLAFGFMAYVLIKLFQGRFKELNIGLLMLTFISLMVFIFQ